MIDSLDDPDQIYAALLKESLLQGCSAGELQQFVELLRLVTQGQEIMNLTAIRNPIDMARYHIADSVALAGSVEKFYAVDKVRRAADIGTGAGFPLLPMAILWPGTQWFGVESIKKKAEFVRNAAAKLKLSNVDVIAGRAEDIGRGEYRAGFDLVTSRAVGAVASLLEVSMPLLKIGGQIHMFKTAGTMAEWDACAGILRDLGGHNAGRHAYALDGDDQERVIFVAEKIAETPEKYPRAAGVPFKKPLLRHLPPDRNPS